MLVVPLRIWLWVGCRGRRRLPGPARGWIVLPIVAFLPMRLLCRLVVWWLVASIARILDTLLGIDRHVPIILPLLRVLGLL